MAKKYLHELEPFREIMEAAAAHHNVPEYFVEKDYWIMHSSSACSSKIFDLK